MRRPADRVLDWDELQFLNQEAGVYLIYFSDPPAFYVGESYQIGRRVRQHFENLGKGKHSCALLQARWDRTPADEVRYAQIVYVQDEESRLYYEAYVFRLILLLYDDPELLLNDAFDFIWKRAAKIPREVLPSKEMDVIHTFSSIFSQIPGFESAWEYRNKKGQGSR